MLDVKAVLGERRGVRGREGANAWVDYIFFLIIFGLTVMATVYKGKD